MRNDATKADALWLDILGMVLEIGFEHSACRDGVAAHLSGHLLPAERHRTPDIRLWIALHQSDRYLYREREMDRADTWLDGVWIAKRGEQDFAPWMSHLPPLIPYHYEPAVGRFVGLHAGCVALPNLRAVIFGGDRGSGKSTIARSLCNSHGGTLLTDEATFIHRRTRIVEPMTLGIGVHGPDPTKAKAIVPARDLCERLASDPALASHLVFLEKVATPATWAGDFEAIPLGSDAAFLRLMRHHIDLGTATSEVLMTLTTLAGKLPTILYRWSDHRALASIARHVAGS